ncbi:hypothetical protein HC176_16420 [Tamlana crocina]|uniref:Uncharacterized protein n=2 Tax=Tamlana crocina TaxID=393006 RepID=A0ABX1DIB1_9FLAO|nr:hypothetical protein [Tamlana crocina]
MINLEREIRSRYDNDFFEEVLNVQVRQISDFVTFLNASGFPRELLEKEKEMNLIQFLLEQSTIFNEQ